MTDEQINAAIAEACGWNVTTSSFGIPPTQTAFSKLHGYDELPNYCNDLNAMHEAEQELLKDSFQNVLYEIVWEIYINNLCQTIHEYHVKHNKDRIERMIPQKWVQHATARQKAEAFLRTIEKWKEAAQ